MRGIGLTGKVGRACLQKMLLLARRTERTLGWIAKGQRGGITTHNEAGAKEQSGVKISFHRSSLLKDA